MTTTAAVRQTRSIFLGGPFKALVDTDGAMDTRARARFEALIEGLEAAGYQVHNAHRRESWGAKFLTPDECTRLDYDEIAASSVFIAFPGHPASPGTHIEIGWASAMGKPIVLLLEEGRDYAFLVRGLHTVADVTYLTVGDTGSLTADVLDAVRRLAGQPTEPPPRAPDSAPASLRPGPHPRRAFFAAGRGDQGSPLPERAGSPAVTGPGPAQA
ncbi:Nucleoside 2-deoxyribosyltransferase [Streptomyces sp. DvalAA-14]|uniref:nucleoside 2-deoxyribosyltransferase n=1 Tax=unclassified Streptomyces TaxID=2593676 RepID=UPI00081B282A|nr:MULTISPECIES: nucleoside 2-deoxyribosyltransferase [unclassified Streptomyces]SCE38290.1 Nucleoside 2-deoxyribosyltransferase [Streptomyces sp. DvalAA-14]